MADIALDDEQLLAVLDTYESALFAGQASTSDVNASACASLLSEAKERGLDVDGFTEVLGFVGPARIVSL